MYSRMLMIFCKCYNHQSRPHVLAEPKCTETDLERPSFVPVGANLTQFGWQV